MLTVIYPGSFDPITNGHMHVLERAAALFHRVIVAVAQNSSKAPAFSTEQRVKMLREAAAHLENVEVDAFEGLLVHYARDRGAAAVVKGLRALTDFEYEIQQAMLNRRLDGGIETIFLPSASEHQFLSSSIVKEIVLLGGEVEGLVPRAVAPELEKWRKAKREER